MSVTKITKSHNSGGLLRYVLDDKPHNGAESRYVLASARNCTISNARSDFKAIRDRFNKSDNIQAYSIVISWGKNELDPDNYNDIETANEVANRVAVEVFGEDRQVVIVLATDGAGGNLHAHVVGNSIDMKSGKSMRGYKTGHHHLMTVTDRIQQEMNVLNTNLERTELTDKQTIKEIKARDKGTYIWKDDLKDRIYNCMYSPTVTSYETFKQELLEKYNVEVTERKSKRKEAHNGYILTYRYKDKNNKERKARETSLGSVVGLKGLDNAIKQKLQMEQQRQAELIRQRQQQQRTRYDFDDSNRRDGKGEKGERTIQSERVEHLTRLREQLEREYKQVQRDRQR